MIALTRPRGERFHLNPDLVETLDEVGDTVITLVDGKRILVAESAAEVAAAITAYRGSVMAVAHQLLARTTNTAQES
jgi:flagellar protein FlbD